MKKLAAELLSVIEEYYNILLLMPEVEMALKERLEKWSKKEIVGHLVDSAQCNIRRFIVGQYEEEPLIFYNQEAWVKLNNYQEYKTADLIQLWFLLNKQIVHIWQNMSDETAERKCSTPDVKSIKWLSKDYIKHLKHHMHVVLNLEPVPYP